MSILERAKAVQAKAASDCHVNVRLDLLEGLIAEVERLQAEKARPATAIGSVADIRQRHQLKEDPS